MNLNEYVRAIGSDSYVTRRASVLTPERWRWIWRQHKQRFIESDAAVLIGGQVHVHPDRADAVILEVGRALACRQVEVA